MKTKLYLAVIAIIILLYIVFQIDKETKSQTATIGSVKKVTFAASKTFSPAPIWIAKDLGFFKQAGIDAEVINYSSGKTTTEAMLKDEVDISASAEFLAVKKYSKNKELRILSTSAFVHQIKLLTLNASKISKISDLKGKRIGVRIGTNGEFFLSRLLTLNNLQNNDISWINISPQDKADAMAEGTVDGVITWPPFVQHIQERLADKISVFDGQPGQDYYYVLLTKNSWYENNKDTAVRVMQALKMTEEWIFQEPEKSTQYFAKKFELEPDKVSEVLKRYRFSISLPQTLITAMEAETRWLQKEKQAQDKQAVNYLDMILFEPLLKVSPADVTIVH
ncbi:MAG: ABC transporter substrate-binding protein [Gammaproteobacteria bacterium]|nr:ABC transporter substrate-binding protein [Gammaproteobacteria bacterium]